MLGIDEVDGVEVDVVGDRLTRPGLTAIGRCEDRPGCKRRFLRVAADGPAMQRVNSRRRLGGCSSVGGSARANRRFPWL